MVNKLFLVSPRQRVETLQGLGLKNGGTLGQTFDKKFVVVSVKGGHFLIIIIIKTLWATIQSLSLFYQYMQLPHFIQLHQFNFNHNNNITIIFKNQMITLWYKKFIFFQVKSTNNACLIVIVLQLIQRMHNLGQLKSRQLHRHSNIQPIARATSFHTIDLKKRQFRTVRTNCRDSSVQNQYDLANIVHQILQLKPRTAPRLQQKDLARIKRAETLTHQMPKVQSIISKTNPVSLVDILRGKRQEKGQTDLVSKILNKREERREQKLKQMANKIPNIQNTTDKINDQEASQYHVNFQTIKFPEGVCRGLCPKQISITNNNIHQENSSDEKRLTVTNKVPFVPKNKLSIKNIDKIVHIQAHKDKIFNKTATKSDFKVTDNRDTIVHQKQKERQKQKQKQKQKDNSELLSIIEKRSKKSLIDNSIPSFIKASLQVYKQEPSYGIVDLQRYLKSNEAAENKQIKNIQPVKDNNEPLDQKYSEDNLLGAKLILYQKQKRKSMKVLDSIRPKGQNPPQTQDQPHRIFRLTNKPKTKKSYLQDQINHKICGWQQGETGGSEAIYFKE